MPKITFLKLEDAKKIRIEEAILKELLSVPFEEASIKRIIEDANIPRGSFYQYFEDKEDAFIYVLKKQFENTRPKFTEDADEPIDIFKQIEKVFIREMTHIERKEHSTKALLFKQIARSEWAMQAFTQQILMTLTREPWFLNWFKVANLDDLAMEAISELLIGVLKESLLVLLDGTQPATMIHQKLTYKLDIIECGITSKSKSILSFNE